MENTALIISIELKPKELQSSRGVIKYNSTTGSMEKGILTHINKNGEYEFQDKNYVNTPLGENDIYVSLAAKDMVSNKIILIDPKQFVQLIKARVVNKPIVMRYRLEPIKFYPGQYMNNCLDCSAHFQGYKRQPFCKECCEKLATAVIIIPKKDKPKTEN